MQDLQQCVYAPSSAEHILGVGWLERDEEFSVGPTSFAVYQRLQEFAKEPWQPFIFAGSHSCELCQYEGERSGTANIFIPFEKRIFVCPELILHYMNAHQYQPPKVFCDAVLACPEMNSMEYKKALLDCNGKVLWQNSDSIQL